MAQIHAVQPGSAVNKVQKPLSFTFKKHIFRSFIFQLILKAVAKVKESQQHKVWSGKVMGFFDPLSFSQSKSNTAWKISLPMTKGYKKCNSRSNEGKWGKIYSNFLMATGKTKHGDSFIVSKIFWSCFSKKAQGSLQSYIHNQYHKLP